MQRRRSNGDGLRCIHIEYVEIETKQWKPWLIFLLRTECSSTSFSFRFSVIKMFNENWHFSMWTKLFVCERRCRKLRMHDTNKWRKPRHNNRDDDDDDQSRKRLRFYFSFVHRCFDYTNAIDDGTHRHTVCNVFKQCQPRTQTAQRIEKKKQKTKLNQPANTKIV